MGISSCQTCALLRSLRRTLRVWGRGCRRIMTRAPLLVLVLSLNVFRVWDSKASRLGEAVRTIIADEDHLHSAMRPPDRSQYPEGTHNQKLEHESCRIFIHRTPVQNAEKAIWHKQPATRTERGPTPLNQTCGIALVNSSKQLGHCSLLLLLDSLVG